MAFIVSDVTRLPFSPKVRWAIFGLTLAGVAACVLVSAGAFVLAGLFQCLKRCDPADQSAQEALYLGAGLTLAGGLALLLVIWVKRRAFVNSAVAVIASLCVMALIFLLVVVTTVVNLLGF